MILGLVWTLILRLQISEFELDGVAGEKGLLLWCQRVTKGYPKGGNAIKNFSRSWKPGLPFVAIIHHFRPDIIEFNPDASNRDACEAAFAAAESLGIVRILDVEDICDTPVPDKKIVMTYIAEYFKKFAVMEAADSKCVSQAHRRDQGEFARMSTHNAYFYKPAHHIIIRQGPGHHQCRQLDAAP